MSSVHTRNITGSQSGPALGRSESFKTDNEAPLKQEAQYFSAETDEEFDKWSGELKKRMALAVRKPPVFCPLSRLSLRRETCFDKPYAILIHGVLSVGTGREGGTGDHLA
eukprot:COSAG05_NODE_13219_length_438_cov_0.607670_1_plen_109_part_01